MLFPSVGLRNSKFRTN